MLTNEQARTVVVTQLTGRSLPIPEDPDSNPVIANFIELFVEKTKIKKKRPRMAHFLKKPNKQTMELFSRRKARRYLPNCQTNLVIALNRLSLLF